MLARRAWGAIAVVTAATSARATAQQSSLERLFHQTVLDNGLHVIVVENHAVPLATAAVAVRSGASAQQPGEEGLAHLYEHILFRAYGDHSSAFEQEVGRLNGASNATTGEDVVTYYVTVPSDRTLDAVRLLSRMVPRAQFQSSDLSEERPVVLDELKRNASDPERVLERQVAQHLWGDAWHRKDVGGDSASLGQVTIEQLRRVYGTYYVPNNSALIVTGDVLASEIVASANKHFSGWRRGPDPFVGLGHAPVSPLGGSTAVLVRHDVQDITILIQLHGPGLRDDAADIYAADVLFEALNEDGSALQQDLVSSGLFQSLSISLATVNDVGAISVRGKTTEARAQEALIALATALDQPDLLTSQVTEDDLVIGKHRRALAAAMQIERVPALATALGFWWAAAGVDYYLTYAERMAAQSLADLQRVAVRYLAHQPRVIGVLGPLAFVDWAAGWLRSSTTERR